MNKEHQRLVEDVCAEDHAFLQHEDELKRRIVRRMRFHRVARLSLPIAASLFVAGVLWQRTIAPTSREPDFANIIVPSEDAAVEMEPPAPAAFRQPDAAVDPFGDGALGTASTVASGESKPVSGPEPKAQFLTDEELLAAFPPGSCFLAEVEGRTILVFRDAELQQKYFR